MLMLMLEHKFSCTGKLPPTFCSLPPPLQLPLRKGCCAELLAWYAAQASTARTGASVVSTSVHLAPEGQLRSGDELLHTPLLAVQFALARLRATLATQATLATLELP